MLRPYHRDAYRQTGRHDGMRPPRTYGALGTQHPEHLLNLCRQLGRIAQAPRPIARGPQPIAQALDVIGDRTVDARGTQRPSETVAVPRERIGDVARDDSEKVTLQATERGRPGTVTCRGGHACA